MKLWVWMRCIPALMVMDACLATCYAQYRVLPGKADSDGCMPTTPARVCLGATGEAHCYAPPNDKHGSSEKEEYTFGLEPKAKAVGRFNAQELTLFTAMFSGCGSGTLTHLSLLTVRDGQFANLLPKVELTEQSEYKFWSFPQVSSLPILVTADFIWDFDSMKKSNYSEETHFARHRYTISLYMFDSKSSQYVQAARYETTKKYPGLDDVDEIHVLDAERPAILAKLRRSVPSQ